MDKNNKKVIWLIIGALILCGAAAGYYFYTKKPYLVYELSLDLKNAHTLRPRFLRGRPYAKMNLHLTTKPVDVTEFSRIQIKLPSNKKLKLLEEIGGKGLFMSIFLGGRDVLPDKKKKIEYKAVPYLEDLRDEKGEPAGYFIELDNLNDNKKYIICTEAPSKKPRSLKYFFAFYKQ